MNPILQVLAANPTREFHNLWRRIFKLSEENGEVSEAFLYATSDSNLKGKTYEDVREEAVDAAIVAIDIALTRMPGEEDLSDYEIQKKVEDWFLVKLQAWDRKRKLTQVDECQS